MRRIFVTILSALCVLFTNVSVFAEPGNVVGGAPIVNVKYIHDLIQHEWGVHVPYNPELKNPLVAANMRYLLTAVDAANSHMGTSTQYRETQYATDYAANTNVTIQAVRTLIVSSKYHFTATTTSDTTAFSFVINAAGKFSVDWGDGTAEKIAKYNTSARTLTHQYATAGVYEVRIGGVATAYAAPNGKNTAISFESNKNLAKISGSLGRVFPSIGTDMPVFFRMFHECTNLKGEIPGELFSGIVGAPAPYMFRYTFASSSKFSKIQPGLFSGISGAPANDMYLGTFYNGYGLSGEIPVGLFGNISGPLAQHMFDTTFYRCRNLTGPSARNPDGVPLYEQFSNAQATHVMHMYTEDTKLSDYADIPDAWK